MSELHATPDTFSEVLAAARPGDTIVMAPGVYTDPIEIPKGVKLQGSKAGGTRWTARHDGVE